MDTGRSAQPAETGQSAPEPTSAAVTKHTKRNDTVRSGQRQEKGPESVENDPPHRAQLEAESYIRQLHHLNRCRLNRLPHRNAQDLVGEIDAGSPVNFDDALHAMPMAMNHELRSVICTTFPVTRPRCG